MIEGPSSTLPSNSSWAQRSSPCFTRGKRRGRRGKGLRDACANFKTVELMPSVTLGGEGDPGWTSSVSSGAEPWGHARPAHKGNGNWTWISGPSGIGGREGSWMQPTRRRSWELWVLDVVPPAAGWVQLWAPASVPCGQGWLPGEGGRVGACVCVSM